LLCCALRARPIGTGAALATPTEIRNQDTGDGTLAALRFVPAMHAGRDGPTGRSMKRAATRALVAVAAAIAAPVLAVSPDTALPALHGAGLPLLWGVPFAGLLLSIALVPLVAADFWHRHYGKVAAAWVLAFLVPFALRFGATETIHQAAHALLLEYVPFVVILFSLFTITGGICVRGALVGTPARNTGLLALGALLASVMGTTGASMMLIRPLLTANEMRPHKVHVVVFFILLVGNVGGALSPLGDPPLFIGFLKGVDFFWTTRELARPTALVVAALLGMFWLLDRWLRQREPASLPPPAIGTGFALEGSHNFLLIAGVIGAVLLSGLWDSGITLSVLGTPLDLENLVRDALLVGLALLSLALTPAAVREHNRFHWGPIIEVAKLFAGIFVTIIPVIAILAAARAGALAPVIDVLVDPSGQPRNVMVFWMTGLLSAFLDNAPTYLVFFNMAGGDPKALMGPLRETLAALSMGAVYFGALTYIGNAPNFMIKAIAEDRGVAMPSFLAYTLYAAVALLPLMVAVPFLFL
jgi:Na+/H+ antiporter NhaD/arsenite permease-like protein